MRKWTRLYVLMKQKYRKASLVYIQSEKIKIKSELFIKAVNSPARVVIKERMLISKKGQYKKISYVNLFETDVKSSDSNIIFADILEYCARSLNVKKLFWKNKNNGYFNLVLFMR